MMTLSDRELAAAQDIIRYGLNEDLRYGPDVTTMPTVPAGAVVKASMVPREPGVIAGVDVALLVLDEVIGADGYHVLDRVEALRAGVNATDHPFGGWDCGFFLGSAIAQAASTATK